MAERATIHAQPRTVLGKKVSRLRKEGILPANIFGRGLDSTAVQVDARDFVRTVRTAGVRSMFELQVAGEAAPRYVVIRSLARHGGTGGFIHADFYQVDLQRPIQTNVGLAFVGEAPAVRDLAGTLLTMIDFVSVRCLPLDIPESISVNLARLTGFDVTLTVGDLDAPAGVEILTDVSVPVATVTPPRLRLRDEEGEEGGEAAEAEAEAEGEETAGEEAEG
jgi:large subunit ribosomal protein L25